MGGALRRRRKKKNVVNMGCVLVKPGLLDWFLGGLIVVGEVVLVCKGG